jgi:glycosyltransferase involved in cell wall biosynthesis
MDLSVILQFHSEGWLAHPTLRALERVVRHAESRGRSVEVVATLDRTRDDVLRAIVARWSARFSAFHTHEVDLGDPALSRNWAVGRARGRYVATHDGDNLYGLTWFAKALDFLEGRPRCIAHPHLIWLFQHRHLFWVQEPVVELADFLRLNPWDTVCMAAREVFESVPYRPATQALAYEDWAWNCDTVAAGFEHAFVPETVVAKREKPVEESNEGAWIRARKTVHPNPLFEYLLRNGTAQASPAYRASQPPALPAPESPAKRRYRKAKDAFKARFPKTFQALLRAKQGHLLEGSAAPLPPTPEWAVRELDELRALEPALGDYRRVSRMPRWSPDLQRFITPQMRELMEAERPAVMLLPWLERGGADLEALHYLHATEGPLFAILTGSGRNRWKDRVPAHCTVIDLTTFDSGRDLKLVLLHRLLLQAAPRLVHNLNSREAYDLFVAFPGSFQGMRRCATFFCADQTASGEVTGYIVQYLPRLLGFFDRISTDSESFRAHLIELFGLPEALIETHRMPFSPPHFPMRRAPGAERNGHVGGERPLRLLFAGRLDRQKRPDLACEIVRGLRAEGLPVELDLWGGAHLDPDYFRPPARGAGIDYRGDFDGLAGLPLESYDALLLPSKWEGLPNTLIEAMGNGLPVVAAATGGVPELVRDSTGWLIADADDPEAYRRALRSILADRALLAAKGRAAREAIASERSWADFVVQARRFYGEASER